MSSQNIPAKFIKFAEEIGKLLVKYDFGSASFDIRPGFDDSWRDNVHVVWTQGRHGDAKNGIAITSTVTVGHKFETPDREAWNCPVCNHQNSGWAGRCTVPTCRSERDYG